MATLTLAGTASSLMKYTGAYIMYIPLAQIDYFMVKNGAQIEIGYGTLITGLPFDDEAQRDAAITTLLGWF